MRIKKYQTEVFAGITDCVLDFMEGMNVLVGANEAGKSTVLAGMYYTLFQPTNIRKNSQIYTEFELLYRPINGGNYADGSLAFVIGGDEAVIEKSWFEEPSVKFRIGDTRWKSKEAEEELSKCLKYGQAFYNHVVFGRQSHEDIVLQWLFDVADAEGRDDIRKRLSELSSVMGGIDLKRFEGMLDERLNGLAGHWDVERNAPELDNGKPREAEKPWKKGCGKILEAYYAWQHAKRDVDQVNSLNVELKQLEDKIKAKEEEEHKIQQDLNELEKSQSDMQNKALRQDKLRELEKKLAGYKEAAVRMPHVRLHLEKAERLSSMFGEQKRRQEKEDVDNRLSKIGVLERDIDKLEAEIKLLQDIEQDTDEAERLEREAERLENKLSASRLSAHVILAGGKTVCVEDMKEKKELVGDTELSLNGFARFSIPDVGDITVNIEEINIEEDTKKLNSCREAAAGIYDKYGRQNLSDLKLLNKECGEKKRLLQQKEFEIKSVLGGDTAENLRLAAAAIVTDTSVEVPDNLSDEIREFLTSCGERSLDAVIGADKNMLQDYISQYESDEKLMDKIAEATAHIDGIRKDLAGFADIGEPQIFDKRMHALTQSLSDIREDIKRAIRDKGAKEHELEDRDAAELMDVAELKQKEFEQQKQLYDHYSVIKADFTEIKELADEHEVTDCFRRKLSEYLAFITDGAISLQTLDESLRLEVQSGGNVFGDSRHLSEGTKQTILLAYKLAVLEFFFREEGGVIVLDDCLLDMDADRREKSVQLLKRFSEHNQVIFSTCDMNIADMLGGHIIRL